MSNARLISVEVERFKSYEAATRIDLAPLTVIVGRNNSGKSTLIQALLLLKQTLAHPRADVPVHLEGPVDALEQWLRENVSIVEVDQDAEGRSSLHASRLTSDGMLSEHWPADFMDEASEEERAIYYYASLDKAPASEPLSVEGVEHDTGPEPDFDSQP